MVIIVAAILSSAASFLKPYQERNARVEKINDILKSVRVVVDKSEAEKVYDELIVAEYAINPKGEIVSKYENGELQGDIRPFDLNLKTEQKKLADMKAGKQTDEPLFPIFVCRKNDSTFYVIPLRGKGLWGPVWGNISLLDDFRTVYGVTFGHKGETPGLGAEIATPHFMNQFRQGKTIFDDNYNFTSVAVVKGGIATLPPEQQTHGVDAISGGTITSKGVSAMLHDCLEFYIPFIKSQIGAKSEPAGAEG
ncbi:MAG: Na(+)-translocating NADH-quinone reductase subunit C [Bacteroidales bacterium]